MKVSKSDIYFIFIFLAATALTIFTGTYIWPTEKQSETFWYTLSFLIFLEALLFLKPVAIDKVSNKTGGFWAVLFSFNFVYTGISLSILLLVNVFSKGKGPWVMISTLSWTVLFLFTSGLFIKTAAADSVEENIDASARSAKRDLIFAITEALYILKPRFQSAGATGIQGLSDISIVEKLAANMSPGKDGMAKAQIEAEIFALIDTILAIEGKNELQIDELSRTLTAIKMKLRMRESILRK